MNRKTIKLKNRSGNFPCDICGENEYLEEHHIEGRKISNPNHSSNLCNICPNCHYKVHLGIILIEQWVSTTSGTELLWHTNEELPTIKDSTTHII